MPKQENTSLTVAGVLIATFLSGCAVGPDYNQPKIELDATFVNAGAPSVDSRQPVEDIAKFWSRFNDPLLSALIERALIANGDVRIARARLQESQAFLRGVSAEYLPEVDVTADAGRSLSPKYLSPGLTRDQRTNSTFNAGFVASWELDFFGRIRRENESAAAQLNVSEYGVHAAQVSVVAEVARNYLELRGLQQRFLVARKSLENQLQTVGLTVSRFDAGRGNQLDVARARSLFDSTEATLPALQTGIEHAAYRLSTLTAQRPRDVLKQLEAAAPLPDLPLTDLSAMPLGTPQQLLRRRPDLVVAERQLAASSADIGIATADLFPRISLTGLLGFATDHIGQFGNSGSQRYAVGAGLTWPLLDFGRVRSRIDARKAQAMQALANFEQAISLALEETEGSLSQFTRTSQQASFLASSTRNAETAAKLSRLRFSAGSADLLVVLDSERQALTSQDAYVQAQVRQATALVGVYRSIGGGWPSNLGGIEPPIAAPS